VVRCALCRIDRKGRFVFADEQAEKLFGLDQVELFGKPLIEFLDPSCHEVIDGIIGNRNYYEAFHDAVNVILLSGSDMRRRATIILSPNLRGGTPVNFNIIVYPDIISDEVLESPQVEEAVDPAQQLSEDQSPTESTGFTALSTFSTVELLGRAGIGAVLSDSRGAILDSNQALMRHFGPAGIGDTVWELVRSLGSYGASGLSETVSTYFETCSKTEFPPDLTLSVTLPSGYETGLTVLRLAPGSDDLSSFLVFQPTALPGGPVHTRLSREFLTQLLEHVYSCLKAGYGTLEKLQLEHSRDLNQDGSFHLNLLDCQMKTAGSVVSDINDAARSIASEERPEPTDIEIMLDRLAHDFCSEHPSLSVSVECADLPKVRLSRNRVTMALKYILGYMAQCTSDELVSITVSASLADGYCRIVVISDAVTIPHDNIETVFDYPGSTYSQETPCRQGERADLSLARELVTSVGGLIDLEIPEAGGLAVVVSLPTGPE